MEEGGKRIIAEMEGVREYERGGGEQQLFLLALEKKQRSNSGKGGGGAMGAAKETGNLPGGKRVWGKRQQGQTCPQKGAGVGM